MDWVKQKEILVTKLCSIICFLVLAFSPLASIAADPAPTQNSGDQTMITNVLCAAVNQLTGGIGRAITIIIVISLGILLLLGKVTWGVAIALAVGIGVIFGAKDVVNILSGGANGSLCS